MNIPSPAELNIPFPSWREAQLDAMERCMATNKQFIVIDAPTGVGKSGIAIGLHYLLGASRTVITTSTKYLQQQYNEAFGIPTIWGRGNYPCAVMPSVSAEDGPCVIDKGCDHQSKWTICEYYKAKKCAASAPIAILNNSYFLHEANYAGAFSNADLLVFDEGHLLESSLMSFVGVRLPFKTLAQYTSQWQDIQEPMQLLSVANQIEPIVHNEVNHATEQLANSVTSENLQILRRVSALHKKLIRVKHTDLHDWVLNRDLSGFSLVPIVVKDVAYDYAFRHGKRIIIMSATILNGEVFGRQLGIEPDDIEFISVPSPFMPAMRQVLYCPAAKLNYKSSDAEYQKLFDAINLIATKHSDQSGVIHCVSYKLRDHIMDNLTPAVRRRIITHGKEYGTREDAIDRFKRTLGSILLSPSAEVGLDFPDDEARFAIWAKLPFADLQDKQVKARSEMDKDWYPWLTLCSLIQGSGRIVRHDKDWGITYILDKNLGWMLKYKKHLFAPWFLDALHVYSIRKLKQQVDKQQQHQDQQQRVLGRGIFAVSI